ncbi:hypothetical protein [Streptomyces clavifer]|uniref:hypothetical protein n=1 Tax=Streptomyces clavifer TaxID=68188 RepID=UPI0038265FEB
MQHIPHKALHDTMITQQHVMGDKRDMGDGAGMSRTQQGRGKVFPIVETFGYPHDCTSVEALAARAEKSCPFTNGECEKQKQYAGMGYCSVRYSASWDDQAQTYAVCDHRLDGKPTGWAVNDYFQDQPARLVPEVTVTQSPQLNLDYVAYADDPASLDGVKAIAIETQAIDLRGGGVGPAWRAWEAGEPELWREYFTKEAEEKKRPDTVNYGINTGNVYKRLGTQVAIKGEYLKQISVPLYVVMQHKILEQLRSRINFVPLEDSDQWDITFMGFDYDGNTESGGRLAMPHVETVRTSLDNYTTAMTTSGRPHAVRTDFLAKVKRKAASQLQQRNETGPTLF